LHSVRVHGKRSMNFMLPHSPMAEVLTVLPAFDYITAPTFTRRMCATRMATRWLRFVEVLRNRSNRATFPVSA